MFVFYLGILFRFKLYFLVAISTIESPQNLFKDVFSSRIVKLCHLLFKRILTEAVRAYDVDIKVILCSFVAANWITVI